MNQIRSVSVRMDADVASCVAKMKLAGRETEKAFDGASINSRRLNSDLQATEQRLDRVSQAERQVESSTRSASTQLRSMDNDVVRLNRDLDRGGNALDSYSGRVSLLAQAGAVLGPALLPIGAVAVPALTGLATAATAGTWPRSASVICATTRPSAQHNKFEGGTPTATAADGLPR